MVNHANKVKDLMEHLDFLYFGKGNLYHIYDVCHDYYIIKQNGLSLQVFFSKYMSFQEEFNCLLPVNPNFKTQYNQQEHMIVMSFLTNLEP